MHFLLHFVQQKNITYAGKRTFAQQKCTSQANVCTKLHTLHAGFCATRKKHKNRACWKILARTILRKTCGFAHVHAFYIVKKLPTTATTWPLWVIFPSEKRPCRNLKGASRGDFFIILMKKHPARSQVDARDRILLRKIRPVGPKGSKSALSHSTLYTTTARCALTAAAHLVRTCKVPQSVPLALTGRSLRPNATLRRKVR